MSASAPLPAGKHPDLIVRQAAPFNAGPPLARLAQTALTPTDLFFVRNHGAVPALAPAAYQLDVAGPGAAGRPLTLADLRAHCPRVTVAATLQCAGNRRAELAAVRPIPNELEWGAEAIGHAQWSGFRLSDVLALAGLAGAGLDGHVELIGADETERHGHRFPFGGSVPMEKALGAEVLLADEMNGRPLPAVHGAPLRAVVPGYIGARSVKWLRRIALRPTPSENYFQARAYRLFPPYVTAETVDWERGLRLGEMSLTAVICAPGEAAPAGAVAVRGYALAGGRRAVARVDVSVDGGQTWVEADWLSAAEAWSWRLWEARWTLAPGRYALVARAVDTAGNTQPAELADVWNFKGYMNNAWHRASLTVQA